MLCIGGDAGVRAWRVAAIALAWLALAVAPARAAPIAFGAYIPGASYRPALIDAFARQVGREPAIVSSYKDWSSLPFARAELDSIWRRGAVPMITWEPWTSAGRPFPLRAIAAGRFDRYLRRSAGSAANWGRPLMVRFAQEMNGDWFPWGRGVGGNTARDFRKAWKHVVDLFRREGATNVRWVWAPNEDSGGRFQLAPFYPGDRWVDWIGLDGFNYGGAQGWPSFTRIFGSSYDRIVALSPRPLMISETGCGEEWGDKAAWISSALLREAPRYPRLRALVWFDKGGLRVDSSAGALSAVRDAVSSRAYGATRRSLLAAPPRLASTAVAPSPPEGGYGAPSFLVRAWHTVIDGHRWAVAAALAAAAVGLGVGVVALRRARRGRKAA